MTSSTRRSKKSRPWLWALIFALNSCLVLGLWLGVIRPEQKRRDALEDSIAETDEEKLARLLPDIRTMLREGRLDEAQQMIAEESLPLTPEDLLAFRREDQLTLLRESSYRPGDFLFFGFYEQDADLTNGPEPIEWQVIKADDGELFLLSRRALAALPFESRDLQSCWSECELRSWLNRDFAADAFDEAAFSMILPTELVSVREEDAFYSCVDHLFLLSSTEYLDLLRTDVYTIEIPPSAYALSQKSDLSFWWHWTRDIYGEASRVYCFPCQHNTLVFNNEYSNRSLGIVPACRITVK